MAQQAIGMIETKGLSALIEARRSICLLHEGRTNEAASAIDDAASDTSCVILANRELMLPFWE